MAEKSPLVSEFQSQICVLDILITNLLLNNDTIRIHTQPCTLNLDLSVCTRVHTAACGCIALDISTKFSIFECMAVYKLMSERHLFVTFVDSDVLAGTVCLLLP